MEANESPSKQDRSSSEKADAAWRGQQMTAERAAASRLEGEKGGKPRRETAWATPRVSADEIARRRLENRRPIHAESSVQETKAPPLETARTRPERENTASSATEMEISRIRSATDALTREESLKPERWKTLDVAARLAVLHRAGRILRDRFECADPPIVSKEFPEYQGGELLGFYRDGATKDAPASNYDLSLSLRLLANDDPRHSMETYLHEFRHAYQHEMAARVEKPQFRHLAHDTEQAAEWSRNFRDYQPGPPSDMPTDHPAYPELFERYYNQPVERDARQFAEELLKVIYRPLSRENPS